MTISLYQERLKIMKESLPYIFLILKIILKTSTDLKKQQNTEQHS